MIKLALTTYILVWPTIALAVLVFIVSATMKEFRKAREKGSDVV